jgi:hypothetical protein
MLDAGGCLTIDAVVRHLTRGASPQNVVRHLSLDQTWSKRTLVMGTASRLRLVTPRQLRREDTHTTHTHTHTHTTQAPRAGDSASLSLSLSLSLSSNPSILLQPDAHPAITTRARAHTHTHTHSVRSGSAGGGAGGVCAAGAARSRHGAAHRGALGRHTGAGH